MSKQPTYARAFIGDLPLLSQEAQIELCRSAVDCLDGLPPLKHIYQSDEFDLFVADLEREANQIAIVARLVAIAEKNPKGRRRGVAFHLRLDRLTRAALVILDAETGIRSDQGDAWTRHVEITANRITNGRTLSSVRAKKMAAKKHAKRPRGIEQEWKSPAKAEERKHLGTLWRDPSIPNAAAALEQIGEKFPELDGVSRKTIERIVGGRTLRAKRVV